MFGFSLTSATVSSVLTRSYLLSQQSQVVVEEELPEKERIADESGDKEEKIEKTISTF